jgi:hypothetical protein
MFDIRSLAPGFLVKSCLSLILVLSLLKLATHQAVKTKTPADMSNVSTPASTKISVRESPLSDGKMFKFYRNDEKLSYKDGLQLMRESQDFRSLIVDTISKQNYAAVFWEFPPVSKTTDPSFEFIVNNARSLSRVKVDKATFRSYFKPDCQVVTFSNLGGDANLVVPCPASDQANYAHLASFLRSAPKEQIHELLRTTAQEVEKWLANKDRVVWLSTSGAGVYYLHVRLDSRPKYYTYSPYKDAKYSTS